MPLEKLLPNIWLKTQKLNKLIGLRRLCLGPFLWLFNPLEDVSMKICNKFVTFLILPLEKQSNVV